MNEIWKQWEGQVVNGKFPLQKFLGGSGHGIVFLTQSQGPEPQKAAIKLVLEDARADARLSVWARTTALSHPNLLQIYECGRCRLGDTALLYVVMEYAEEDLAQILPVRALIPAEAAELIPPAVSALNYLHGQGFVHGHLKPTNITAVSDQVKLSSDGLCVVEGPSRSWADHPGMDVYDPVYDPPEAEGGVLTQAADIWSLGVTLVEVLTLRRRIWDRTGRGGSDHPELILPEGIPEPFLDIVRHCLVPEPQQRWTAAQVSARLEGRISVPAANLVRTSDRNARETSKAPKTTPARWLIPTIAAVGVVVVLLIVGRMRHSGQSESGTSAPAAVESSQVPPSPAQESPVQAAPKAAAAVSPAVPPKTSAATPSRKSSNAVSSAPSPSSSSLSPASARPAAPASGMVPGAVLQQNLPEVSKSARSTIQGHVKVSVKVAVDAAGNVKAASLDSAGPSQYFAKRALDSVQGWKFTPPQMNGRGVPSEWLLKFSFSSGGIDVRPAQVKP